MAQIITIANQKGGVSKTTTALATASILAKKGFKVLLVDLDAQGNSSLASKIALENDFYSVADILMDKEQIKDCIIHQRPYDILQSSEELPRVEMELTKLVSGAYKLARGLKDIENEYDYVIIDTPPQLSILTSNALVACDKVIIPVLADVFSQQGIEQIMKTIVEIKEYFNHKIKVDGILLTRYSDRLLLSKKVKEEFNQFAKNAGTKLFKVAIRETIAVKESQYNNIPLTEYENTTALVDYENFVDELLEK